MNPEMVHLEALESLITSIILMSENLSIAHHASAFKVNISTHVPAPDFSCLILCERREVMAWLDKGATCDNNRTHGRLC